MLQRQPASIYDEFLRGVANWFARAACYNCRLAQAHGQVRGVVKQYHMHEKHHALFDDIRIASP